MDILEFSIDINAPKEKVWDAMFDDATYRRWTGAFHEGSYYTGSWDEGSTIKFLALDEGKLSGLTSKVVRNIPHEYISLEHLSEVVDGKEDFNSVWVGAHENYRFKEDDGVTTVTVQMDGDRANQTMAEMLGLMWPKALNKLKEIVEKK